MNRQEILDIVNEAIEFSLDIDWTTRDAAEAVVSALTQEGLINVDP